VLHKLPQIDVRTAFMLNYLIIFAVVQPGQIPSFIKAL
jgi:hypothetical protein